MGSTTIKKHNKKSTHTATTTTFLGFDSIELNLVSQINNFNSEEEQSNFRAKYFRNGPVLKQSHRSNFQIRLI